MYFYYRMLQNLQKELEIRLIQIIAGNDFCHSAFFDAQLILHRGNKNMSHPEFLKRPKRLKKVAQRTQRKAQSALRHPVDSNQAMKTGVLYAKKVSLLWR